MALTERTDKRDEQSNFVAGFAKENNFVANKVEGKQLLTREGDDVEKIACTRRTKVALDKDHVTDHESGQVDGLWSIAVGIAAFVSQVLLGGCVFTGGIFYTIYTTEYPETSIVAISWLCTLPFTLWFIGSPVGSIITNIYGCRKCAMIGSVMAGAGLSLGFFVTNFYMVFAFYGLLAGFGHSIQYVGILTSVSRYFSKYRTSVMILSSTGSTFGMALYSFLVPYLVLVYTVSLILSGILMALTPVVEAEAWVLTFVALLSFAYNVTGGHSLAITLELAGQEYFADAVGFSLLFKAAGTLLAGSLAGILYEVSGSYTATFYMSGSFLTGGCLSLLPATLHMLRKTRDSSTGS